MILVVQTIRQSTRPRLILSTSNKSYFHSTCYSETGSRLRSTSFSSPSMFLLRHNYWIFVFGCSPRNMSNQGLCQWEFCRVSVSPLFWDHICNIVLAALDTTAGLKGPLLRAAHLELHPIRLAPGWDVTLHCFNVRDCDVLTVRMVCGTTVFCRSFMSFCEFSIPIVSRDAWKSVCKPSEQC